MKGKHLAIMKTSEEIITFSNEKHLPNALFTVFVTKGRIDYNAFIVTGWWILTWFNDMHFSKAKYPILMAEKRIQWFAFLANSILN